MGISLQKNWINYLQLTCRNSKEACGVTQTFLQEWFNQALMHSDCANKSTYADMWSLDGSLAGACCMSTAGSWLSFFCSECPGISNIIQHFPKGYSKVKLFQITNFCQSTALEILLPNLSLLRWYLSFLEHNHILPFSPNFPDHFGLK